MYYNYHFNEGNHFSDFANNKNITRRFTTFIITNMKTATYFS